MKVFFGSYYFGTYEECELITFFISPLNFFLSL